MGGMDAIIAEFLAESTENLDQLDQDLVALEKDPSDREIFARIFRTIHTIKGTCGFLAFGNLESVAHVGESVLARLRDGTLELTPEITSDLLAMIDAVRAILANIDRAGTEGDEAYSELIERLAAHDREAPSGGTEGVPGPKPEKSAKKEPAGGAGRAPKKGRAARAPKTEETGADQTPDDTRAATAPVPERADAEDESIILASTPTAAESNIRIDVRVLDDLMNLVGELVLARNQLVQDLSGSSDARLLGSAQRLDGVTSELQEAVMRTRMQPVSSIWQKLPRVVRDLAVASGKQVELVMEGEDTDLDKSVIEAIKGSLLHLVRNAVDHGIEDPAVRKTRGKPAAGTLRLRAQHEGDSVVIEVRDDGRGLDHERICARAVKAGLLSEAEAAEIGFKEIEGFIFQPGFSTAHEVTNVSGRGVGLDVVRANVESIGGSIELQSEPGESTTFRVKIPLTLAIVSVLLVSAGEHRIAVPQASVVELVRLEGGGTDLGIEDLSGVPVCRLRGRLLPLVFLNRELGLAGDWQRGSDATVVVLQGDDRQFGLVVDSIEDSQEIVVKPLGRLLSGLPYAGATILGNGQIALILDIFRLGLAAGVVSENRARTISAEVSSAVQERISASRLLCLRGPDDERMAVDFDTVSRLEHFAAGDIELVGGRRVVQYGGEILPLFDVGSALPERRSEPRNPRPGRRDGAIPVVVCTARGRLLGLVVHQIADIVEESAKARRPASREGVAACTVVDGRVTEVLDLEAVVRIVDPEFFRHQDEGG